MKYFEEILNDNVTFLVNNKHCANHKEATEYVLEILVRYKPLKYYFKADRLIDNLRHGINYRGTYLKTKYKHLQVERNIYNSFVYYSEKATLMRELLANAKQIFNSLNNQRIKV